MRDLYWTFRNFRNRVAAFLRYRRVTANMDERFPVRPKPLPSQTPSAAHAAQAGPAQAAEGCSVHCFTCRCVWSPSSRKCQCSQSKSSFSCRCVSSLASRTCQCSQSRPDHWRRCCLQDAQPEDLARCDGVCIICREDLAAGGRNKKLPCSHVFHLHCLRCALCGEAAGRARPNVLISPCRAQAVPAGA